MRTTILPWCACQAFTKRDIQPKRTQKQNPRDSGAVRLPRGCQVVSHREAGASTPTEALDLLAFHREIKILIARGLTRPEKRGPFLPSADHCSVRVVALA
jgi:hypothetical protein